MKKQRMTIVSRNTCRKVYDLQAFVFDVFCVSVCLCSQILFPKRNESHTYQANGIK